MDQRHCSISHALGILRQWSGLLDSCDGQSGLPDERFSAIAVDDPVLG
jgi:hypothetical protein